MTATTAVVIESITGGRTGPSGDYELFVIKASRIELERHLILY